MAFKTRSSNFSHTWLRALDIFLDTKAGEYLGYGVFWVINTIVWIVPFILYGFLEHKMFKSFADLNRDFQIKLSFALIVLSGCELCYLMWMLVQNIEARSGVLEFYQWTCKRSKDEYWTSFSFSGFEEWRIKQSCNENIPKLYDTIRTNVYFVAYKLVMCLTYLTAKYGLFGYLADTKLFPDAHTYALYILMLLLFGGLFCVGISWLFIFVARELYSTLSRGLHVVSESLEEVAKRMAEESSTRLCITQLKTESRLCITQPKTDVSK